MDTLAALLSFGDEIKKYDARQPRDDHGKWSNGSGGISVGHAVHVMKHEGIASEKHHADVVAKIKDGTHKTREDVLKHIDSIHKSAKAPQPHEGSTGKVTKENGVVRKSAFFKNGERTNEGKVYAALEGVEGIAQGKEVGDQIHVNEYRNVIGVDDVPLKNRAALGNIVGRNEERINRAVSELSSRGVAYNDQMQFGLGEGRKMDLLDFSNVSFHSPDDALAKNIDDLTVFYRSFGASDKADHVRDVYDTFRGAADPEYHTFGAEGQQAEAEKLHEALGGKPPRAAYYTTNAREIGISGAASTPKRDGRKIVIAAKPLPQSELDKWELTPVIELHDVPALKTMTDNTFPDDTLIAFGDAIKSVEETDDSYKFGAFLVVFDSPDISNLQDSFTKSTDFGFEDGETRPLLYNHGLDGTFGKTAIGKVRLYKKDAGVWMEGEVKKRRDYLEKHIQKIGEGLTKTINVRGIEAPMFGASSGAGSHTVIRETKGQGHEIKQWHLAEASITPTPCEPQTACLSLKSLVEIEAVVDLEEDELKAARGWQTQPRDDHGKWTDGAGNLSASHVSTVMHSEGIKESHHHDAIQSDIKSGKLKTRADVLARIDAIHAGKGSSSLKPVHEMTSAEFGALPDDARHSYPDVGPVNTSHSNYYGAAVRAAIYNGDKVPADVVAAMPNDHTSIIKDHARTGRIHPEVLQVAVNGLSNSRAFEFHSDHAGAHPDLQKKVDAGRVEFHEGLASIGNEHSAARLPQLRKEFAEKHGTSTAPDKGASAAPPKQDNPAFEKMTPAQATAYLQAHHPTIKDPSGQHKKFILNTLAKFQPVNAEAADTHAPGLAQQKGFVREGDQYVPGANAGNGRASAAAEKPNRTPKQPPVPFEDAQKLPKGASEDHHHIASMAEIFGGNNAVRPASIYDWAYRNGVSAKELMESGPIMSKPMSGILPDVINNNTKELDKALAKIRKQRSAARKSEDNTDDLSPDEIKAGRTLSAANHAHLSELLQRVKDATDELEAFLAQHEDGDTPEEEMSFGVKQQKVMADYVATMTATSGVIL